MKVALAPTRRSELTRAPSIKINVRPRARPRIAGTAAWPSDTWLTPATFSMACIRFAGWRTATSRADRLDVAAPGVDSMLGADPDTVTDSLRTGATVISNSVAGSSDSIRIGREYVPARSMTKISNGTGGSG